MACDAENRVSENERLTESAVEFEGSMTRDDDTPDSDELEMEYVDANDAFVIPSEICVACPRFLSVGERVKHGRSSHPHVGKSAPTDDV